jgi:autotransporter-associated beta strand protein
VENCTNTGSMPMIRFKMRVDTPGQDYENLRYNNLTLGGTSGTIISVELNHGGSANPQPPRALIRNISVSNVKGSFGSFGTIANNSNTDISNLTFVNFNVKLTTPALITNGATGVSFYDVFVNAVPWTGSSSTDWSTPGNWDTSINGIPSTNTSALFNSSFNNQPRLTMGATAQALCLVDGVGQDVIINADNAQTLALIGNATENNVGGTGILMTDTNNHNLIVSANVGLVLSNATSFINQETFGTLTIAGSLNNNGNALTFGGTGGIIISGPVSGSGPLTAIGAGTVTLSGANTYSGPMTVNNGKLVLSTAQTGTGTITVADGATLGVTVVGNGQLSPTSMTLGSSTGATLEFDNLTSTASPPLYFGSLVHNGKVTVNIDGGNFIAGATYPLMPGTSTNGFVLGALPSGIQAYLTVADSTINLTMDNIPTNVPPTPIGLTATAENGEILLSWTASSGAAGYIVGRSTVDNGPYTSIITNATTGYLDTGLINGTTYYYVVIATNAIGESTNSTQVSATPQLSAPPSPSGLNATGGNAQVSLSWTASAGATNYYVKRSMTSDGPYTIVASSTVTNYVNTGLADGTTYYYIVSAVNGAGQSTNSSQVAATPLNAIFVIDSPGSIVSGSGTSFTTPVTVTPGANALVVLIGNMKETSTTAIPTVTWNGQTLTNAILISSGSTGAKSCILYIYNPTTDGTAHNLSCTFTTGTTGWRFQYYTLSGVNTAVPPLSGSVTGGTTTISCTVNDCPTNGLAVLNALYSNNASAVSLPAYGSGILNALYISTSNPTCAMGYANYIAAGTDTYSATTTTASSKFALTVAVFTPAVLAQGNTAPNLPPVADQTINVGVNLSITNNATDSDTPAQTLTYSLTNMSTSATIGASSGIFNWRPLVTQANTTNPFTVVVTDNGTPNLSATQSFSVTVNPLTLPTVSVPVLSAGQIGFSVSGQAGPDYAVQASSNLTSWNTVFITNSPAMPFTWSTNAGNRLMHFYRIKTGPPLP